MRKELFTSNEVCEVLGITPRRLKSAIDEGIVDLGRENPKGPGKRRRFSRREIVALGVAIKLSLHGFTVKEIKRIFGHIWDRPKLSARLDPDGVWRRKLREKPISVWTEEKTTRSRVRLIVTDIESSKRPMTVRFTALHRPPLRLDQHGGVRIIPIESVYRKVERIE